MKFAFKYSSREEYKDDIYERPHVEDIHFDLKIEDTVYAGKSLDASVVVQSESEETREILVNLTAMLNFYTGVSAKRLKSTKLKFVLNSREGKEKLFLLLSLFFQSKKRCHVVNLSESKLDFSNVIRCTCTEINFIPSSSCSSLLVPNNTRKASVSLDHPIMTSNRNLNHSFSN